MKETVITPGMKRRELIIMLLCFLAAYGMNIAGIIKYHTPLKELVTKIPVVLLVAAVIYLAVAILRVLYLLVAGIWKRNNTQDK